MGIDKADIRLVVHWQPPRSLEEYIQQSGRAGRDGREAYCLLLHTKSDWAFLHWAVGVGKAAKAQAEFVHQLIELLHREPVLTNYRENLYQRIYSSEPEKSEVEDTPLEGNEEDEEEETAAPLRREMGLENLERTLSSLERAGVLEYEYLPGRVLLQGSEDALREHLTHEDFALLCEAGYRGSERGDILDFSRLPPERAQDLDQKLYLLFRERKVGLYHYREPLLRVRAGERLEAGYRHWDKEGLELEKHAKERLDQVQRYAENGRCRAQSLLKRLGESPAAQGCGVCDVCAQNPGPWEALEGLNPEELERAYRPLDTLLAFFAWAEDRAWSKEARQMYLGRRSTLMALRGQDRSQAGVLGRKYTENRFFGHLSFIKPKELEAAFEKALKEGYLEEKDRFEASPLYGLTERGRARYERRLRREGADGA